MHFFSEQEARREEETRRERIAASEVSAVREERARGERASRIVVKAQRELGACCEFGALLFPKRYKTFLLKLLKKKRNLEINFISFICITILLACH